MATHCRELGARRSAAALSIWVKIKDKSKKIKLKR
jgi:hypothetical protein